MRVALIVLVFGLTVGRPVPAADERAEQTVTPISSGLEQHVEPVASGAEQRVERLGADGVQQVSGETQGPVRTAAGKVAKVMVGVLAAGVSLGAMAAQLLFF